VLTLTLHAPHELIKAQDIVVRLLIKMRSFLVVFRSAKERNNATFEDSL